MLQSTSRVHLRRCIAGFTAFSLFWSSVLPAQTAIVPRAGTSANASGNTWTVDTTVVHGGAGIAQFNAFSVGAGDVANMRLPGGVNTLLNIVHDQQTTISGTVNALKNGSIGGNLYFANPHGIVVGPSGIVNAGALHLSTPSSAITDRFKEADSAQNPWPVADILSGTAPLASGASITVRGRINTQGGVELLAPRIDIDSGSIGVAAPTGTDAASFAAAVNVDGLAEAAGVDVVAGEIALRATDSIQLTNATVWSRTAASADALSTGNSGPISLTAPTVAVTNSAVLAHATGSHTAGAVELRASDVQDTFLFDHPFTARSASSVTLSGARVEGSDVTVAASSSAGYLFKPDDPASVAQADSSFWSGTAVADDLINTLLSVRPLVGVVIAESGATVRFADYTGGATPVTTRINAAGKVDIQAAANSQAGFSSYGTVAAVGYGKTTANATVDLQGSSQIVAGRRVDIGATIDNETDIAAEVIDLSEGSKRVPVDFVVAVGRSDGLASTTLGRQASVTANGTALADGVRIAATSTKDLSTSAESSAGNDLAGAAVAFSGSNTRATNSVSGTIKSASGLEVVADATTDGNETSADTTLGDSSLEGGGAHLSKAGVLQALVEKLSSKLETKVSDDSKADKSFASKTGLAATVVVADHRNEAIATVGAGAKLEAGGKLSVLATTTDRQQLSANAETSASRPDAKPGETPPADKDFTISAAVIVGNFDNVATATVEGAGVNDLATLDARGPITVKASADRPFEINWPLRDLIEADNFTLSGLLKAIPDVSNFGVPDAFFTSWAQSTAEGERLGVAGSVDYLDFGNTAAATIGEFAAINRNAAFFTGGARAGNVDVLASSTITSVNLSGVSDTMLEGIKEVFKKEDPKKEKKNPVEKFSSKGGLGGSYLGTTYTHTVKAQIERGAVVDANALKVEAGSDTVNVAIAIAGAKSGNYSLSGSFTDIDVIDRTLARIDDGAVVSAASTLSVLAHDDAVNVNTAGALAKAEKVGIGASVTLNDFDRETIAAIGLDPSAANAVAAAGSVTSGAAMLLDAKTSGSIWSAALSGAVKADDKDLPTPDTPTLTDPESSTPQPPKDANAKTSKTRTSDNKGTSGLHISGDVAINEIADDTRAYVNGGATVDAGVAGSRNADGDFVPSLTLTATNDSAIWALGGAVTANLSSGSGGTSLGIAGSFAMNDVNGATEAFLGGSGKLTTHGDLALSAARSGGIRALTASLAGATQKSGLNLAGNVSINELDNTTAAYLLGADVDVLAATASEQRGDIRIAATDSSNIYAIAGAATLGGKAGVGASIAVNTVGNETRAYSSRSRVKSAGNLALSASNANDIRVIGASLGITSGPFSLSGVGVGNTFRDHKVEAFVDNTGTAYTLPPVGDEPAEIDYALHVLGDVSITATDTSGIDTIAAAAGASKAGIGIGASVAVNRIEQSGVSAYAKNVTYERVDQTFSLQASSVAAEIALTADEDMDIEAGTGIRVFAGAAGLSKGGGAGVAVAVNRFAATTDAYITGPLADITARNVRVDAGGAGKITAIAVGVGAGGKFGAGGSIVTNYIGNTTRAHIDDGARVEGRDNVAVRAATDDRISVAAGSAGIGFGGLGLGASVTVNKIESQTSARIGSADGARTSVLARTGGANGAGVEVADGGLAGDVVLGDAIEIASYAGPDLKQLRAAATKTVTGVAVNSMSTQHVENIDVNVAAGKVGLGAAVNVNLVNGASVAEIVNADINRADTAGAGNQQVDVTAGNVAYGNGFVGNVSVGAGAAGAGVDVNVFNRTTRAGISHSDVTAASSVAVDARSLFGASSVVVGASVGGVALVGSGSVAKFTALTEAVIAASRIQANIVDVRADAEHHLHLVGGGVAGGGTAASGTFALAIDDSTTRASIVGDPDERSKIRASDGVSVIANGLFDITTYAIGGAFAGGTGVAGVASVNLATSVVEATVERTDIGEAVDDVERPVGSLRIDATGDIRLTNIAGALAVGGGGGVGAGASVNVLKSRVAAELVDSTVHAELDAAAPTLRTGRVDIGAHSLNDVDATAIMAGAGGSFGIGGAAVVTLIGTVPDAEMNSEVDKGGNGTLSTADSLSGAGRLDDVRNDDESDNVAFAADDADAIDGQATHDLKTAVLDEDRPYATVAAVRGAQVTAQAMRIQALDESAAQTLVGGFGVGAFGAGGGVGVTSMRSNVAATLDATSTLTLVDGLRVRALAGRDPDASIPGTKGYVDITAMAGAAGLVGLGAAVAIGTVDNVVTAQLDGTVTAGSVVIEARDDTGLEIDTFGAAAGALAAGASIGRGAKTSTVTAATGDTTGVRHASITTTDADAATADGAVSIQARSGGKVDVDVTAVAGGLGVGGAGADARASDTSTVTAKTGKGSVLDLGTAALSVNATAETAASATARGIGVSLGAGIGVSIARATASATVTAQLAANTDVTAGLLTLSAAQVRRHDPVLGLMASAASYSSGSGGGLLFGFNASNSEAVTGSRVEAAIDAGSLLDIGGDVSVLANADGVASATVSGLAGGLLAVGANDALATSSSTTTARVAGRRDDSVDGTSIGGSLLVHANGADGTYASATAGAGGLIAGAAAKADTDNRSTTLAQLESAPRVDGRIEIRAQHRADFNGLADSTSASLFGASGGRTGNTVVATVDATVAKGAPAAPDPAISAGGLTLAADNAAYKISNGFDLTAGAGGLLGGAAASTFSGVTLITRASIAPNAALRLLDTNVAGGGTSVSAQNRVDLSDRVKLDAGGAIAVARAESAIVATLLSQATLGANALLDSVGDVYVSAGNQGSVFSSANAKTYGLAGAAQGHSQAVIDADGLVTIGGGARIRSDGNITLAAGRDAPGAADSLRAVARTDLYNKTVFPVQTSPDADAVVRHDSVLDIAAGGRVNAVRDLQLIADRGTVLADGQGIGKDMYRAAVAAIASFFSKLFGGGEVNLDIHGGSSVATNSGLVRVDGEAAAGIQHARRFDVDAQGNVLTQSEGVPIGYVETTEDLIANLLVEYQRYQDLVAGYAGNPNVQAAYDGELMRIRRQLADLGYTGDPKDAIGGMVPVDEVPATFLNLADIRARGGDIAVVAGSLVGKGSLSAPGNASITIENKSAKHLRLDKLTIEDGGGKLSFNGALVGTNLDIARRNVPVAGEAASFTAIESGKTGAKPRIDVINSYIPVAEIRSDAPDQGRSGRAPDIQITDDIINTTGTVAIRSLRGNVVLGQDAKGGGPKIIADTIDIEAGNDFIQPYQDALYNIGGAANDPTRQWAVEATANESRPKPPNASDVVGARPGAGSIIAGNNVFISARILNINGTVQSGIADWSVTLGSELNDDIDAFRTGYLAAVAAGDTPSSATRQLSAFIDDPRGTIGAFYNAETDLIELEGVRVRGGYMQLFGDIINTGGGQLKVMDGYGRINVTNDTDRELVVNGLDTGHGIEGTLLITDTSRTEKVNVYVPKTERVEERVRPVTTRFTRIGEEMKIEELVLLDDTERHLRWVDADGANRQGAYDIADGKRYVWTTGLDKTTQTVKYRSSTSLFGFIPIGNEAYDLVVPLTPTTGPLPAGDFTRVDDAGAADYSYAYESINTTDEQFAGRDVQSSCTVWFFGCIVRTYTIKDTFVAGSRDFHTHSVKADHDIGIEFIGTDEGVLAVNSGAGIRLGGLVRNASGAVSLTAGQGAITSISESSAVRGTSISLIAKTGIGSAGAPIVTEAGQGPVTAITGTGDVVLTARQGDLVIDRVSTGAGEALISADEDLLGTAGGTGPHVSARRIQLESTLGGIGADTAALRIAAGVNGDSGPGGLSASAPGSIFVTQTTGDLEIDSVVSGGGDVGLTALDGDIRDGNTHDTRDTRAEEELSAQWDDMRLLGDRAEQSKADTIEAFRKQRQAAYHRYWQQRTQEVRTVDDAGEEQVESRTLPYDPAYSHSFSAAEVADMKAAGADDAGIAAFADARTREYHDSHARFGADAYNPDFQYQVTSADLTALDLQDGYKWTVDDLRYGQNLDVLNRTATDTETVIEAPNVAGRNVSLLAAAGSVGTERASIVIDGNRPDDPLTPINETHLTRDERIALSAAESDDVGIDEAARIATIVQREDIDIVATGALHIEGRSHVYLGGEQDLNIESVTSNGQVRIKGAEGIFDVSTGAAPTVSAAGLIVEAAHGNIGAPGDPLRIALAAGTTLTARAGGSAYLDERLGDLRVASVLANGSANLTAQRNIIDARAAHDSVAINAAAIGLSSRAGDVGGALSSFSLFAQSGAFGGRVAGNVYASTPRGDLRVDALHAGGKVQLRAPRSLLGDGPAPQVTGQDVELVAATGTIGSPDHFFSVDSNGEVVASAATGLWYEEWDGDLHAQDIGTRTGPLQIRVRHGNALFDHLFSDDAINLDLAGGSLVVGYLEADGVDLTVREEGATLLVHDMRIADGARLRADRILLPKLLHTGSSDTLLLDFRGNDAGIADLVDVDIESASPVTFTSLGTRVADIFSTSRDLSLFDATITERGEIRHPANFVVVDNGAPRLLRAPAQIFSDGDPFFLALSASARLLTSALLVSYDDNFVVNAFSTENSVLRQTRKTLAVQDDVSTQALDGRLFAADLPGDQDLINLDLLDTAGFWRVPAATRFSVEP